MAHVEISGLREMLSGAAELLMDGAKLRDVLRLDLSQPAGMLATELQSVAKQVKRHLPSEFPAALLQRIMFMFLRERFDDFAAQQAPQAIPELLKFVAKIPDIGRRGHAGVLGRSLAPDERNSAVTSFEWAIEDAPEPTCPFFRR
jgi:hypothetical protein